MLIVLNTSVTHWYKFLEITCKCWYSLFGIVCFKILTIFILHLYMFKRDGFWVTLVIITCNWQTCFQFTCLLFVCLYQKKKLLSWCFFVGCGEPGFVLLPSISIKCSVILGHFFFWSFFLSYKHLPSFFLFLIKTKHSTQYHEGRRRYKRYEWFVGGGGETNSRRGMKLNGSKQQIKISFVTIWRLNSLFLFSLLWQQQQLHRSIWAGQSSSCQYFRFW